MSIPERHRALAHEFVDGVEIERLATDFFLPGERWVDDAYPNWDPRFEYRRKPKEKVKKWLWTYKDAYRVFHITKERMSEDEVCRCFTDQAFAQKIDGSMKEVD